MGLANAFLEPEGGTEGVGNLAEARELFCGSDALVISRVISRWIEYLHPGAVAFSGVVGWRLVHVKTSA
jgi:hypothetical protein